MFTWNNPKIKKTDEEIAYDISDLLFAGQDVRSIERTIIKELRARRVETIDWLIEECEDKILELKLDERDGDAVTKLKSIISSLRHYRDDAEHGYIPVPQAFNARDNAEQTMVSGLVWLILVIWGIFWFLRG